MIPIKDIKLTIKQQAYFELIEEAIKKNKNALYSSHERGWGKTTVINKIGFVFQALEYEVYLLTMFGNSNEYFATNYLSNSNRDLRGKNLKNTKTIIIVDEYDYHSDNMFDVLECCAYFEIPIIGFVNYKN